MSFKEKHPLPEALSVAKQIVAMLAAACERIEIAGSIRRKRDLPPPQIVGDIEILYIPAMKSAADPGDFFSKSVTINAADEILEKWLASGRLAKRLDSNGRETWGPKNKYAVAAKSGIPVDFFAADAKGWWNNLVCRTGSAESNRRIAAAAQKMGQTWHPTGPGFSQQFESEPGKARVWEMTSEQEVFEHVGLPFLPPSERL